MIIKKTVYEKLTEGLHNVTVTGVEDLGQVETKNGLKMKLKITFTASDQKDKEGKNVTISMWLNQSLGAKSTLGKLINQLGFTIVGNQFDVDELLGTKCQIVVEHQEKEGEVYANVASIIKTKKTVEV